MKDTDARQRIASLETTLAELPQSIADIVIQHFEPTLKQANSALEGIESLAQLVHQMGDLLSDHTAQIEELHTDVNAARVDTTALLESQAELSGHVTSLQTLLRTFARAAEQAVAS